MNHINIPTKLCILHSNQDVALELLKTINEIGASNIAIISSKTPAHLITDETETFLFDKVNKLKTFQVINASIAYVNQLSLNEFDLVVGVGGGKVIDTAKYAGFVNKIPCVSIPTSISNDGICSPISVLKDKGNKYKSLGAEVPLAMIVPLHIIEKSNEESLISGIGDLLSNLSAIEDWELASKEAGEVIDDYAISVSEAAAKQILLQTEKYILLGKKKEQFLRENLELIIKSLALSGIAMEIAGTSRPASGGEHLISHSIDELFGPRRQHGIQVALGMYIIAYLKQVNNFKSKIKFDEIRAVFRYLGLPTTLSSMDLTASELIQVIQHAPNTRPERYTFLNKISLDQHVLEARMKELFGEPKAAKHNLNLQVSF